MKRISQMIKISSILFLAILFHSCNNDDDNIAPPEEDVTIVATAQATANLSTLVSALQSADGDLVNVLSGDGPFTVFAPTNDAFDNFLADNNFSDLSEVPTDLLAQILLNHVVLGSVSSSDLIGLGSGYTTTNASGPEGTNLSLYFDTSSSVVINGKATVISADIEASNGIIHIVDEVIGLPTIADFAMANSNLSSLVAAVQLADTDDSDPDYLGTLSTAGTYTVFAPTNTAFSDLLQELDPDGNTDLSNLDPNLVGAVLSYHVVGGSNITSSELSSGMITTLGGDIELDASNLTLTDANDRVSNIIPGLIDIQAINGVVHAIDKVILPPL